MRMQKINSIFVSMAIALLLFFSMCQNHDEFQEITSSPKIVNPYEGEVIAPDDSIIFQAAMTGVEKVNLYINDVLQTDVSIESINENVYKVLYELPDNSDTTIQIEVKNDFQRVLSQKVDCIIDSRYSGMHAINGTIISQSSKNPINNAKVSIKNLDGEVLYSDITSSDGYFELFIEETLNDVFDVSVSHANYVTQFHKVSVNSDVKDIQYMLLDVVSTSLNANSVGVIGDFVDDKFFLSVPTEILKRLDGKPIQYPVTIKASYLDPSTDLAEMPGLNMLSVDPATGQVKPLTSVGAVLIEGTDSSGAELRVDEAKEQATGESVSLSMDVSAFLNNNTNMGIDGFDFNGITEEDIEIWSFDDDNGDLTWKLETQELEIEDITTTEMIEAEDMLKELNEQILLNYAEDLRQRIQNEGSFLSCVDGTEIFGVPIPGSELRLSSNHDSESLLQNLAKFIIIDVLTSYGKTNGDCSWSLYDLFSQNVSLVGYLAELFDIKSISGWQLAGNYSCDEGIIANISFNSNNWPKMDDDSSLAAQLYSLSLDLCSYSREELTNVECKQATINSVNLYPVNCDAPWDGVPIEFYVKDDTGAGNNSFSLSSGDNSTGYYLASGSFSGVESAEILRFIVPSIPSISIAINSANTLVKEQSYDIGDYPFIEEMQYSGSSDSPYEIVDKDGNLLNYKAVDDLVINIFD